MTAKEIMEEKKKKRFPDLYESIVNSIVSETLVSDKTFNSDLLKVLKQKRDFGLTKYGDQSFQASFENSIECPTIEHLREELIDAINYTAHIIYQKNILCEDTTKYKKMLVSLKTDLYTLLKD